MGGVGWGVGNEYLSLSGAGEMPSPFHIEFYGQTPNKRPYFPFYIEEDIDANKFKSLVQV